MYAKLFSKVTKGFSIAAAYALIQACSPMSASDEPLTADELGEYRDKLNERLDDPAARTRLIAKILGSTAQADRHAYLKFHIFGFAGDGNLIPFFTLNNYIVQKWKPAEDGTFEVQHYEVGYYSKFDSTEPLDNWKNPLTDETIKLPHFVLGPVPRLYGPGIGENADTFAPDPLNITMIGDRVYVPTLTRFKYDNRLDPAEFGAYSSGSKTFWDSMLVFSADIEDVFDEDKTHVDADIHMQNLVSWAPYLKLGQSPGRTMVRAYGQHISGYDALPDDVRANLQKYTPEIFDLDSWTETRIDNVEEFQKLQSAREAGTLDIDQEGYVPYRVKSFDEVEIE